MRQKFHHRFGAFADSYAGPKATNLISAFAILSFLSFGTTLNEVSDSAQQRLTWTGIAYQSFLVSYIYFVVFTLLINTLLKKTDALRFSTLTFLYFSVEVLRTIFVAINGLNQNLITEINWPYRVVAGGLTGLVLFGLASFILNDSFRYKVNLKKLQEATSELSKSAAVTESDIKSIRFEILNLIKQETESVLKKIFSSNSTQNDEKQVVSELLRVADDVVRPLSHQLFENSFELPTKKVEAPKTKISLARVFKLATLVNPFQPIPVVLLALFLFIGKALFNSANLVNGILGLIGVLTVAYLMLKICKIIFESKIKSKHLVTRTLFIFGCYSSLVFIEMSPWFLENMFSLSSSISLTIYSLVLANFINWAMAIYSAISFARAEILQELEEIIGKLNWLNARLGAQLSAERQHLASVVHRDVQGKLISAALKFQNDLKAGKDRHLALQQLEKTLSQLTNEVVEPSPVEGIRQTINSLNELWDGIFQLSLYLDESTYSRILDDPICSQTVNDFVGEFTNNSVKHGKASTGKVSIQLIDPSTLEIKMINDGLPLADNLKHGLGSQMVLKQSLSVVHENLPAGGVYFAATIPID